MKKIHYGHWKNCVYCGDKWIEIKGQKSLEVGNKNDSKKWKTV